MKLMELCLSPNKGGLELYFADISNILADKFAVVNVITKGSNVESFIQDNHPILNLQKRAHYFPLISAFKLAKLIDEQTIDVVHMHWNNDLTLAVFAKLLSKRKPKLVLTRHMKFPSKKDGFFHKFLYKNVDHIFAITQTMAHDFNRFVPEDVRPDISVNYLGIDMIEPSSVDMIQQRRAEYDSENNHFLIALVGRIDFDKGHDFLLSALEIAKAKGLPFKALIIGHPMSETYLEGLKRRVVDAGLEDYMVFTGFVDEPRQLMQACDVLVLPTIEETFGLVLIEAMSVGVPVIGSNRGGVSEIIEDQVTGLLFESCDEKSLFEALKTIYAQPELAQQYAEKAKLLTQTKFNKDKHIARLVQGLKEISHV
ncbi:MAG: glycosyltransferase family 4 protein [Ghiorsea sp.]